MQVYFFLSPPLPFLWAYFALILFFWAYFCSEVGIHDFPPFSKSGSVRLRISLWCAALSACHMFPRGISLVFRFKYFLASAGIISTMDALEEHRLTHKRTEASLVILAWDAVRGAVGGRELTPAPGAPLFARCVLARPFWTQASASLLCSVFLALLPALCQLRCYGPQDHSLLRLCLLSRPCCDCRCPWAQPSTNVTPFSPYNAICGTVLYVTARTWRLPHSCSCGAGRHPKATLLPTEPTALQSPGCVAAPTAPFLFVLLTLCSWQKLSPRESGSPGAAVLGCPGPGPSG